MISLYLQINIFVALSWVLFKLLPIQSLQYRASTRIARVLILSALISAPLLTLLPDISFPKFSPSVNAIGGQSIDLDFGGIAPGAIAFRKVPSGAVETAIAVDYLPSVGLTLFLFGLLFMAARNIATWWNLSKLLKSTLTLHKIGKTSVVVSDAIAVPFSVWNLGRAYVVLPSDLLPFRADFLIALRHEIEHHRRRDTFWAVFLEWLVCVLYLNPAIYLWRNTILQLQEFACDEALISRMRISKLAYGSCLLRVAEMALDRRFIYAGTTCMIPTSESNCHSFLRRRINMFAQHERSVAKRASAFALGTFSLFSIMVLAYVAQAAVRADGPTNPGHPVFDSKIQAIAQNALKKGMAKHNASAGLVIVADPFTGAILSAVGVNEGFDMNLKGDWALSYPLQPGSAIKPLIAGSALQQKETKIGDMHICENSVNPFGALSTADTVIHSNNDCAIKISKKLGPERLESSLRQFGIGKNGSAKDYPSASVGYIPPAGEIPNDDYLETFSHGTSDRMEFYTTPLEMVGAYSAMANGGKLMKAILVDGKQKPEVIREVLSSEVAAQMRGILRNVVVLGTAKGIRDSSVALAGKTSTVLTSSGQWITGFIGYAPADKPKLVVYVVMFDPKGSRKFGSTTSAPVFREVMERIVPIYNP